MTKYFIGLLIALGVVAGIIYPRHQAQFSAISIPDAPYLFQTSLQAGITISDTSMTLTSGILKNGAGLSGYQCFTLDTGTATAEYVCGTAATTSVTSLLRGIDPLNPAATSTALTFAHRRGADVRITDFPILQIVKRVVNGQDSFPNPLIYDSSVSTTTLQNNGLYLASVNYVNGVSVAGAANATTTAKGIVQFATGSQLSSGTLQGSTGAFLVPGNSYFNSTPSSSTTVPVTLASGKLAQGFLDLTQNFTFTGNLSLATTTISSTTITGILSVINATSTFSIPPLLTASTTLPTQAASKQYVDNRFSFGNSTSTSINTSWSSASATTTIAQVTFTPPIATRLLITVVMSANPALTQAHRCTNDLFIDNVDQSTGITITNATGGVTDVQNMSFTFITGQVTAAAHTIKLTGLAPDASSCSLVGTPYLQVLNIGN